MGVRGEAPDGGAGVSPEFPISPFPLFPAVRGRGGLRECWGPPMPPPCGARTDKVVLVGEVRGSTLTVEEDEAKSEFQKIRPEVKTYCCLQIAVETQKR